MTRLACKLSLVAVLAIGGLVFAANPAQAQVFGRRAVYVSNYYTTPGYTYPAYYPGYSYTYPSSYYSSSYYTPAYTYSYYTTPSYSSSYYTPSYSSYYYTPTYPAPVVGASYYYTPSYYYGR